MVMHMGQRTAKRSHGEYLIAYAHQKKCKTRAGMRKPTTLLYLARIRLCHGAPAGRLAFFSTWLVFSSCPGHT